jgi:hypothetical protein
MKPLGIQGEAFVLIVLFATVIAWVETTESWRQLAFTLSATASAQSAQEVPDRLVVTRKKNNLNSPTALPFRKTISDQSLVKKIYAAIAALPPFPSGVLNCPNDVGISYHLDFFSGTVSLLAANYEPTGCASLRLSDGTVKSDPTGSFEADLRRALGFSSDRQFLGFQ